MVGLGLAALLAEEGIGSVVAAPDTRTAVALGRAVAPEVVLVDLADGGLAADALHVLARRLPNAGLLVLVDRFGEKTAFAALAAGAVGCVASDAPEEEMLHAIRAVLRRERFVSPCIARRLALRLRLDGSAVRSRRSVLSPREREVLTLVARGCENAEIGRTLHLSPATVKHHVANVCGKLDAGNRLQAAVKAVQDGLVEPWSRIRGRPAAAPPAQNDDRGRAAGARPRMCGAAP
jgi:DNA-binding NarL/FixJ family response regulator